MSLSFRLFFAFFISLNITPIALADSQRERLATNFNLLLNEATVNGHLELPGMKVPSLGLNKEGADSFTQPYIVGGNNASRGEYPEYTLVLLTDGAGNIIGSCGGILIAFNKVLTAGHCSQDVASNYFVIPSFYSFNDPVDASSFFQGSRIVAHPQYSTVNYDIGILTLNRVINAEPAKIHKGSNQFSGSIAKVIGTGRVVTEPPAFLDILQEVDAPITSNEMCNDAYFSLIGIRPITSDIMCAGFTTNGNGACLGDSGGPLSVSINGQKVVVGSVSGGANICEENRATQRYARLSEMTDFIQAESPLTQFVTSNTQPALSIGPILMLLDEEEEN